jgi:hypothetical protein
MNADVGNSPNLRYHYPAGPRGPKDRQGHLGMDSLEYWQALIDIIMMLTAAVGGMWMFFDAAIRFNGIIAFGLVAAHLFIFVKYRFPWLLVPYVIYWLLAYYFYHRQIPEDEMPHFGLRQATGDPAAEAAKLGLPSVRPGKENDESLSRADAIPELELMLAKGDIAGAVAYAEAELKAAEAAGDVERTNVLKKYVLRLQRGKY